MIKCKEEMASSCQKSICAIYHKKDISTGEKITNFLRQELQKDVVSRANLIDSARQEEMSTRSESLLGIWVDKDEPHGEKITRFFQREFGKVTIKADVENLKGTPNYSGYFAVISKESLNNYKFMLYLHITLWHVYNKNKEASFVLVVVDAGIYSEDQNETCLKTEGPPVYSPINLSSVPTVVAVPGLNDYCLHQIIRKLQGPPLRETAFLYVGNVGIGMAYSYFYGYLAHILKGIADTIKTENPGKIPLYFIIVVLQSCQLPEKFSEIDQQISTSNVPLGESIKIDRAGKCRSFEIYVHEINRNQQDCYRFCGEFATPIMALIKMLEAGELNEIELKKQVAVFTHTLRAILERHPLCQNKALVVSYDDRKAGFSLADELCQLIELNLQGPIPTFMEDCASSFPSTLLQKGTVHIVNGEDGEILAGDLEKLCEDLQEISVRHDSLKNLLSTEVNPSGTDEKKTASEKLLIIVTESSKDKVAEVFFDLIQHTYWFPRTTFIIDMQGHTPDMQSRSLGWLEKTGADYIIETQKVGHLWNRIFGSLFGLSSIKGQEDDEWKQGQVTRQLNFPLVNVAKGLAWGYYYNYLKFIGPKVAKKIGDAASYCQNKVPRKLFILLPHSCRCCPTLEETAQLKETLTVVKKNIAGNERKYTAAIYEILGTDYLACVEYCTPVLVLYQMEAEQLGGLSPQQKDAERKAFYEELNKILTRDGAPNFCRNIRLIQYDDDSQGAEKTLSEILVEAIEESLQEDNLI